MLARAHSDFTYAYKPLNNYRTIIIYLLILAIAYECNDENDQNAAIIEH